MRHATTTPAEYSWMGNSWFPPPGVPYLSPLDLYLLFQNLFQKENKHTLVVNLLAGLCDHYYWHD